MDNNPEAPTEQPAEPTVITPTDATPTPVTNPEPAVTTMPNPAVEPTPPVETEAQPTAVSSTPPPVVAGGGKSKLPFFGGIAAVVVALVAGAYFAVIVPNSPTHMYSTGLERSGKALNTLVATATAKKQLEAYTSSQLDGSFSVKAGGQTYSGTIGSRYDKQNSDSTISYNGEANKDLTVKVLTSLAKDAKYPDIYFNVSGLQAMGLTAMMPSLATYDGKWISVTSSYIESLIKESGASSNSGSFSFTAEDAASLAKIAADKTSEYVLTGDTTKAVFEQDKFVGKETTDGVSANRYQVSINQSHLTAYCTDLSSSILSSDAYKHLAGNPTDKSIADQKQNATKDCQKKPTGSQKINYELWINTKTKLVYKLRATQTSDKNTYVEVGQNYTSGNVLPVFANFHSDKDKYDAKLTFTADLEKSTSTAHLTATMSSSTPTTITADLSFKPYSGDVKITVPATSYPLEQVLKAFGLGSQPLYSGTDGSGSISQQRSLLNSLHL
jgi:hypothetical protein